MTESQIMAQIAETSGKDSPTYKAMQANKDRRNSRRREQYAEQMRNVDKFMKFVESIPDGVIVLED